MLRSLDRQRRCYGGLNIKNTNRSKVLIKVLRLLYKINRANAVPKGIFNSCLFFNKFLRSPIAKKSQFYTLNVDLRQR
jgi:hypothetical protein